MELPNISANGFPNCNKSSDAFVFADGCAPAAGAPNKSTIFPELVGDDKNGLLAAADCGDTTFDCCFKRNDTIKKKTKQLISFLFKKKKNLDTNFVLI